MLLRKFSLVGKNPYHTQSLNLHYFWRRYCNKYGIIRLGVFGSVARGEANEGSDIDIVVDIPPDLFKMVHMKEELEQLLSSSVDLIRYQKYMNATLKQRIDDEAIYV